MTITIINEPVTGLRHCCDSTFQSQVNPSTLTSWHKSTVLFFKSVHFFAIVFGVTLVLASQMVSGPFLGKEHPCHCRLKWVNQVSFTCTAPNHNHCSLERHLWFLDTQGKENKICNRCGVKQHNYKCTSFIYSKSDRCYTYIALIS